MGTEICAAYLGLVGQVCRSLLTLQSHAKKIVPLLKFPALCAIWQTDQPMHSQYTKTEHLQTYFTQLTELFLLNPLYNKKVMAM